MPLIQKEYDPVEKSELDEKPANPLPIGESATLLLSFDEPLETVASEPVRIAPAGASPYEGHAKVGLTLRGDTAPAQAIEYAETLFPGVRLTYVASGAHGIVLKDDEGKAYKIYRNSLEYSRVEKEAGALQLLSQAGLAPKLHALVDAGREFRLDRKAYDYTQFGFEDVMIPRVDANKDLPVLVMEYIDMDTLETATPEAFADGYCSALKLFVTKNIKSWDAEFMVDRGTGRVIALDVGELYQRSIFKQPENEINEIIGGLCLDFGLTAEMSRIIDVYNHSGIDGVRAFLTSAVIN